MGVNTITDLSPHLKITACDRDTEAVLSSHPHSDLTSWLSMRNLIRGRNCTVISQPGFLTSVSHGSASPRVTLAAQRPHPPTPPRLPPWKQIRSHFMSAPRSPDTQGAWKKCRSCKEQSAHPRHSSDHPPEQPWSVLTPNLTPSTP